LLRVRKGINILKTDFWVRNMELIQGNLFDIEEQKRYNGYNVIYRITGEGFGEADFFYLGRIDHNSFEPVDGITGRGGLSFADGEFLPIGELLRKYPGLPTKTIIEIPEDGCLYFLDPDFLNSDLPDSEKSPPKT
jgi:hypothetical protein